MRFNLNSMLQTTSSSCLRKRLLLLTLPSADKLMRQQFRTCPIWARALGPLLMNSSPLGEEKTSAPPHLPLSFTLPRPQALGSLRVPEDRWLLFLVSSHWSEGPATPTKIRAQQSGITYFKQFYLSAHMEISRLWHLEFTLILKLQE